MVEPIFFNTLETQSLFWEVRPSDCTLLKIMFPFHPVYSLRTTFSYLPFFSYFRSGVTLADTPPPLLTLTVRAFISVSRKVQRFLASSTRVEMCMRTL